MIQTWKPHGSPYWNYPRLFSLLTSIPEAVVQQCSIPSSTNVKLEWFMFLCSGWLCGESGTTLWQAPKVYCSWSWAVPAFERHAGGSKLKAVLRWSPDLLWTRVETSTFLRAPCDSVNIAITTWPRPRCLVTSLQRCPEYIQPMKAHYTRIISHTKLWKAKSLSIK